MEDQMEVRLMKFNRIYKELDDIYHNYAKARGLSDSAFWVFYFICERMEAYTQAELCANWYYSRQTINSTLKNLEKQGYIALVPEPGNRKNKQIRLTREGESFAEKMILPLVEAEKNSFRNMKEEERDGLERLFGIHVKLLEEEVRKIP